MSFETIQEFYQLGLWDAEQLQQLVQAGALTEEQYQQITGQAYPVTTVKKETIDNNEHSQIQSTIGTGVAQG